MKKRVLSLLVISVMVTVFFVSGVHPASAAICHSDHTQKFMSLMHNNAGLEEILRWSDTGNARSTFGWNEREGGSWDYKRIYGYNDLYPFRGRIINGDDFGNIHYGYVGKAAGFSDYELYKAGGIIQKWSGNYKKSWYKTYYDEPSDHEAIKYGIWLFDHGY